MRPSIRTLTAVAAVTLIAAAGCSRAGSSSSSSSPSSSPTATASMSQSSPAVAGASFGSLQNVCHGGNATGNTDQGVTSSQILAGVLTDVGYTKDSRPPSCRR